MKQEKHLSCIYCKAPGPFTDEHVFPAGMGGDGRNYLLIDLVCGKCNTTVFSLLELCLMRRSPTALGRKFMQSSTRDRGARTSKPSIETRSHYIIDESGSLLEAEYNEGGAETILAQFIFDNDKIYYTAEDVASLQNFYSSLAKVLEAQSLKLIHKLKRESGGFEVTIYQWDGDGYRVSSTEFCSKPPKEGIWLELLPNKEPIVLPRIFQRLKRQLVIKVTQDDSLNRILRGVRRTLPSMQNKLSEATTEIIEQPIVQIEMPMFILESERALAKIGVNFLAHIFGGDFVRKPDFDKIKSSIVTGYPELPLSSSLREHEDVISCIFGDVPQYCHCVILMGVPNGDGTYEICLCAQLYGSGVHKVTIVEKTLLTTIIEPIYFLINYESNAIERLSMLDYQLKYGRSIEKHLGVQCPGALAGAGGHSLGKKSPGI